MKTITKISLFSFLLLGVSGVSLAVNLSEMRVNGFFDLEYEKADKTPGDKKGSFDQYHLNLLVEYPVNDRFLIRHHLEYEHVPALSGGGGSGEIKTEWSYAEYLHSNVLKFRAGFALTPFGFYNENHDATPTYHSIRTPWGIYKTTSVGSGSGALFPKFTTGLYVLGNTDIGDSELAYVAYLGNGENNAANPAEKDENSNKATGIKLTYSHLSGLVLGTSYYTGKKGVAETDHNAYVVSAEYAPQPYGARLEFASSELGTITQEGTYVEGFYRIGAITPFARYGTYDPDTNIPSDDWAETVIGLNYEPMANVILKLENRSFDVDPANSIANDYDEWAAAISVAF